MPYYAGIYFPFFGMFLALEPHSYLFRVVFSVKQQLSSPCSFARAKGSVPLWHVRCSCRLPFLIVFHHILQNTRSTCSFVSPCCLSFLFFRFLLFFFSFLFFFFFFFLFFSFPFSFSFLFFSFFLFLLSFLHFFVMT